MPESKKPVSIEELEMGHFALTEEEKQTLTPEERRALQKKIDEANARMALEKSEKAQESAQKTLEAVKREKPLKKEEIS